MADLGNTVGGFLSGFNSTYFPTIRANEAMALQKAQEARQQALYDLQLRKLNDSEEKDKQAAGLYAEMLGIKPTAYKSLDGAEAEAAGDFMPQVTNPRYEQLLAGGSKAAADLVKQQREQQLALITASKAEETARRNQAMEALKHQQIMAMLAKGQGVGGDSKQPVMYMNDEGTPVWGTMTEARGKRVVAYDPTAVGAKAAATAGGTAQGKRDYNMQGVGDVIDNAERLLLSSPTASGVGAMADRAAAVVGYATPGSIPAQELKQIGGILTSKMPRMEGPQSDKDVMLYREMAGMVGDDTIPVARRVAALKGVRNLVAKYDKGYQGGGQSSSPVRVYNPQTRRLE